MVESTPKNSEYFHVNNSLAVTSGTMLRPNLLLLVLILKKVMKLLLKVFDFLYSVEAIIESKGIPICTEI